MSQSIAQLTGIVSDQPTRGQLRGMGLLEAAHNAWQAAQQAERNKAVEVGQRARERAIATLVETIRRTFSVNYPAAEVRIDPSGYAVAQLDGLIFRSERDDSRSTACLLVLDVEGIWWEIESLAELGAADERVRLMRLRQ